MRHRIGIVCMLLGAALVLAAMSLFLWNLNEDRRAGAAVEEILPQVMEIIQSVSERNNTDSAEDSAASGPVYPDPYSTEMTEVEINGYGYIGYLSIPTLDLELPVMTDWSYSQLKISPCRYTGSTKSDNLVIAAHNYTRHFGNIKNLSAGDAIYFTDMDGVMSVYEVAETEILAPSSMEDMTDSGYALTIFTCTYSGQNRVTVRCVRAE